jgi:hypothetical protein
MLYPCGALICPDVTGRNTLVTLLLAVADVLSCSLLRNTENADKSEMPPVKAYPLVFWGSALMVKVIL